MLRLGPRQIDFFKALVGIGEDHKINAYSFQIGNVIYWELKDTIEDWDLYRIFVPIVCGSFALLFFILGAVTQFNATRGCVKITV